MARAHVALTVDYKIPKPVVKKFIDRIMSGEPRRNAFLDVFPEAKKWSNEKIYRCVNTILLDNNSQALIKEHKSKLINLFDQRKLELITYLENEIYSNTTITFIEKIKAIDTYLKVMESFKDKTESIVQQINISTDKIKENSVKEIFGLPINDVVDVEIKE